MDQIEKNIIEVAVPCPLHQTFSYTYSKPLQPGIRVKVSFGRRELIGIVVSQELKPATNSIKFEKHKLKEISEVIDKYPLFSSNLLALAKFMSQYYFHPIGEVFKMMSPGSSQSINSETWKLSEQGIAAKLAPSHPHHELIKLIFAKKEALSKATVLKKINVYNDLNTPKQAIQAESLFDLKLLEKNLVKSIGHRSSSNQTLSKQDSDLKVASKHTLTQEQGFAFEALQKILNGCETFIKPTLLWGVTGSGKTEVYLQIIENILSNIRGQKPAQVLMLVPEISLTPQMTSVFSERFPNIVGVTHSGLSDGARWSVLEQIRTGHIRILISPRSGVFAPFRNLKLIIVDEEHDSSYKQNSNLRYNGRDIAIYRAKLEGVGCILGSATPSMESYQNALSGKYHLLKLNQRAKGSKLPKVSIIKNDALKRGSLINARTLQLHTGETSYISREVLDALNETLELKQQAIVILNRRGYSYYLYDQKNREVLLCPSCNISLTLHKSNLELKCHYCQYKTHFAQIKKQDPESNYYAIGLGSQKAEDQLKELLPHAKITRLDSDIASKRDQLVKILSEFREGQIDILVGTQILAKGHDFPNVGLTVLLNCDQMLRLPDFRTAEKTFQLMVQAAGRSGRAELSGKVLLQTLDGDDPTIAAAVHHDFETFAKNELEFRASYSYPPFAKLILWDISSPQLKSLNNYCKSLEGHFEQASLKSRKVFEKLKIIGPISPTIDKILNRYRKLVIFSSKDISCLHSFHKYILTTIPKQPYSIRLSVDVDPQNLL